MFLATLLSALVVVLGMGATAAQADGESIFGFLFRHQIKTGGRSGTLIEVVFPHAVAKV